MGMKLIIGLGNPGDKYTGTRHNTGFHMLDGYAKRHEAVFRAASKYKADIATLGTGDDKILLLKPSTFYNLSGEAARAVMNFYQIDPSDILVVHDELFLPIGTVRARLNGGDAGNNGIKSITDHIGPDTARIRIGIASEGRQQADDADYVLSRYNKEESGIITKLEPTVFKLIDDFINGKFDSDTKVH